MEMEKLKNTAPEENGYRLITGYWVGDNNVYIDYIEIKCCVPIQDKNFEIFRKKFCKWRERDVIFSYVHLSRKVGLS